MTASLLATIMTAMVAIMAIGIIYVMIQITAGVFKALWFPALVILGAIVGLAAWTNPPNTVSYTHLTLPTKA